MHSVKLKKKKKSLWFTNHKRMYWPNQGIPLRLTEMVPGRTRNTENELLTFCVFPPTNPSFIFSFFEWKYVKFDRINIKLMIVASPWFPAVFFKKNWIYPEIWVARPKKWGFSVSKFFAAEIKNRKMFVLLEWKFNFGSALFSEKKLGIKS